MKKAKEILQDLGFSQNASVGAQEAFLKHLIKTSTGIEVKTPTEKRKEIAKQLAFDFDPQDQGDGQKVS